LKNKSDDTTSGFAQIPAIVVAGESELKVFLLKNLFSTFFDSKHLEKSLGTMINPFTA